MDPNRLRRLTVVPLLLAALLALGACSSGGDTDPASTDGVAVADRPAGAREQAGEAESAPELDMLDSESASTSAADSTSAFRASGASEAPPGTDGQERAIISKGVVSLVDDDVAQARFDVQKIVDGHDGEVAEEKTQTDDDGVVSRSRLVVRVPVAEFDATMEELEDVAQLASSSRNSEDVTTAVIDNEVRIRAQTESLKRVELLLTRAQSIRDIVAIESQLTRRQAELDSLKSQQAYLADQTSLSTITVFLEQKPEASVTPVAAGSAPTATGFRAGLASGWDALAAFATGLSTVLGALLPFAVLVLLLGFPAWLLLRRRVSAGRTERTPSAA